MTSESNATTIVGYSTTEKVLIGIFISLTSISGISVYLLISTTIIRFRRPYFQNSFYTFALALAVPDCSTLICQIAYSVPSLIIGDSSMPAFYRKLFGWLLLASWFTITILMIQISINRFVAVIMFSYYERIFIRKYVYWLIAFSFVYGTTLATLQFWCSCEFYFPLGGWIIVCDHNNQPWSDIALKVNNVISNISVAIIVILYIFIFFNVKQQSLKRKKHSLITTNSATNQINKERVLMIQFGLICSVLVIYVGSFWLMQSLINNSAVPLRWGMFVLNTFCILNSSINPYLYMAFSSDIRKHIFRKTTNTTVSLSPLVLVPSYGGTASNIQEERSKDDVNNQSSDVKKYSNSTITYDIEGDQVLL